MVRSTEITEHYNLSDCAGISNTCIIFYDCKEGTIHVWNTNTYIFRATQLFCCSCYAFNILRVEARREKKVKNRGGLTNRQLNTYPSFLPQYYCLYENLVVSRYSARGKLFKCQISEHIYTILLKSEYGRKFVLDNLVYKMNVR